MGAAQPGAVIAAVWRIESPRVLARVARVVGGDLALAEELAQDALVAALERWPAAGIPDNPGAWLTAVAKRRAVDRVRHLVRADRHHGAMAHGSAPEPPDLDAALDDPVGDDLLRLVFVACHPVLSADARVALTLRLVCGLTTDEIARAFLVAEPTLAQRLVRAKRTLADQHVPFEVPRGAELAARLGSALEVVYLVFNEGYAATSGDRWIRPALCEEAMRLGRVLAGLVPDAAEVHGLVALMELQASRLRARVGPGGAPVPLLDQDRSRWDGLLIQHGLAALARAEALGGGPYTVQAAIAACHARARTPEQTDWVKIAALYAALAAVDPSPVLALNRAVAESHVFGPQVAFDRVEALADEPALRSYPWLPSVRGHLLEQLGRLDEARAAFERAAELTRNEQERGLLLARAAACSGRAEPR